MRPNLLGIPLDDAEIYFSSGFWILMDAVGPLRTVDLAEGAGFEPAIRFPVYTLSRRAPSTTRPPLRKGDRHIAFARPRATPCHKCMTGPASKGWDRKCSARKGPACEEPEPFPPPAGTGRDDGRGQSPWDPESPSLLDREWALDSGRLAPMRRSRRYRVGRFFESGAMSSLVSEREGEPSRIGLLALASAFLKMGLYGFGGVLPFARRVLVEERGYLSEREFAEILGLCQALPGPNIVNASIVIGERFGGFAGSVTCILSLMTAPLVILIMLAELYAHWVGVHLVDAAIGGMALAAASLIGGNGLKMLRRLKLPLRELSVAGATFVAVGLLHIPLIPVVVTMAIVSFALQERTAR